MIDPGTPDTHENPPQEIAVQRPWSVTLLALGVLIITAINLARCVLSLLSWAILASQPGVSPAYLAASGLIWSVAGSYLFWGLWRAKSWAPRLMQAEALTYALYYWLDLLFLKDHPVYGVAGAIRVVLPSNWQFSAIVTALCLAYVVWTAGRLKVKAYFGLDEDTSNPNRLDSMNDNDC